MRTQWLAMVLGLAGGATSAVELGDCRPGGLPPAPTPIAACTEPDVETVVTTVAELDAWSAEPSTSVSIDGILDLGGGDRTVVTDCDVTVDSAAELVTTGTVTFAAHELRVDGMVQAATVELRAQATLESAGSGELTAATLVMEAPSIDLGGDSQTDDLFCLQASDSLRVRGSAFDTSYGDIRMEAPDLDFGGDYGIGGARSIYLGSPSSILTRMSSQLIGDGRVLFVSDGAIDLAGDVDGSDVEVLGGSVKVRAASSLDAVGFVNVAGGDSAEVKGDLDAGIDVQLSAPLLTIRGNARVIADGAIRVTSADRMVHYGRFERSDEVEISVDELDFRRSGRIERNAEVTVQVAGRLDLRGKIVDNDDVWLTTESYRLYGTHDLTSRFTCTIAGVPTPDSEPPLGCDPI